MKNKFKYDKQLLCNKHLADFVEANGQKVADKFGCDIKLVSLPTELGDFTAIEKAFNVFPNAMTRLCGCKFAVKSGKNVVGYGFSLYAKRFLGDDVVMETIVQLKNGDKKQEQAVRDTMNKLPKNYDNKLLAPSEESAYHGVQNAFNKYVAAHFDGKYKVEVLGYDDNLCCPLIAYTVIFTKNE